MSENKNSLEIEESLIYTRKGHAMITSNPIIECSIFKNDEFNEAYILKSKFDELSEKIGVMQNTIDFNVKQNMNLVKSLSDSIAENQKLKNLLKMKIAGGGGGDLPLQGTGGYAGTVPQGNVQIIIAGGGAGGESHTEQKIEDNPDFTHKGGAFMKGGSV